MRREYIERGEGTVVLRMGPWVTAFDYAVGMLAKNDGQWYYCYAPHLSSSSNRPGIGADWADVWEPWGSPGPQGPAGMLLEDINWRGEWDDEIIYAAGDGVTSGGTAYLSLQGTNLNHEPPNVTWWVPVDFEDAVVYVFASGGADDSAAIQAGYDLLTAGRTWKEKVRLVGDFTILSAIAPPSNSITEIMGKILWNGASGAGTKMFNIASVENVDIIGGLLNPGTGADYAIRCTGSGNKNILISGCKIEGVIGAAIGIANAENVEISGCLIDGEGVGGGIYSIDGNYNLNFHHNVIHDCMDNSIDFGGLSATPTKNVSANHNQIYDCSRGIVFYGNIDGGQAIGNMIRTSSSRGISTEPDGPNTYIPSNILIANNTIIDCAYAAIKLAGSNDVSVHDNVIESTVTIHEPGVYLLLTASFDNENISIQRNRIIWPIQDAYAAIRVAALGAVGYFVCDGNMVIGGALGIDLRRVNGGSVNGNFIENSDYCGIGLYGSQNLTVSGNKIRNVNQIDSGDGHGIELADSTDYPQNIIMNGNLVIDSRTPKHIRYAINQLGHFADNIIVANNLKNGYLTGAINSTSGCVHEHNVE